MSANTLLYTLIGALASIVPFGVFEAWHRTRPTYGTAFDALDDVTFPNLYVIAAIGAFIGVGNSALENRACLKVNTNFVYVLVAACAGATAGAIFGICILGFNEPHDVLRYFGMSLAGLCVMIQSSSATSFIDDFRNTR